MKIICTVAEFAEIVRGCQQFRNAVAGCAKCPLSSVCINGFIEQFVSAKDVVEDENDESHA